MFSTLRRRTTRGVLGLLLATSSPAALGHAFAPSPFTPSLPGAASPAAGPVGFPMTEPTSSSESRAASAEPGTARQGEPGAREGEAAEEAKALELEIAAAARLIGLEFDADEIALMRADVEEAAEHFGTIRAGALENGEPMALVFDPLLPGMKLRPRVAPTREVPAAWERAPAPERPAELSELYFADLATLAALIRAREVSCVELTELFLARLAEVDEELSCVIRLLPERALAQARALDAELERGEWRGPLHGIPWGAKDLLAVAGAPTTWGAQPYREQRLEEDASVVARLDAAGAVLVAKLTLGALAWGDVWYGGRTRNPWRPEQGSSGSSAGSASAVAAGAVPFAIGSETYGSIVSPSSRCGNTSLRPTFGRVARSGAMTLCWTLDKLGPMARSAADCALVLEAIQGPDGRDASVRDLPFEAARTRPEALENSVAGWRVGVPRGAFDRRDGSRDPEAIVLTELRSLGVELVDVDLPEVPVGALMIGLHVEAAAAFDELTRSGRDDELTRQVRYAWPNVFRAARLIPAVEYVNSQRLRVRVMREVDALFDGLDAIVLPTDQDGWVGITNLTGHPTLVAPCTFRDDGTPRSISFSGPLFDEERLLALARAWQGVSDHHRRHPGLE